MILATALSLWCSLSVRGAGLRIEVMRFSLLVVLTVALLSVAFRINSHHTSSSAGRGPRPTVPTGQPAVQPTGQPTGQPTAQPTAQPTGVASTPAAHPHKAGGPGPTTSRSAASGPAGGGPQTLPVTGWDSAVKLGALAFLMIGSGTLAMRAGTPRRQRPDTLHD